MEKFVYSGGSFVNVGDGRWEEWQQNRLVFRFTETRRDGTNITLNDGSRNIWVLLPVAGGMSHYAYAGSDAWTELYTVTPEVPTGGFTRTGGSVTSGTTGGAAVEPQRLRLSAWVGNPANALGEISKATDWRLVRDDRIHGAFAGNLDDLSPVATVMWQDGGVSWSNPGCLPGYPEDERIALCQEAVRACHAAGVQILAGYEYVDGISAGRQGGARFAAWLKGASDAVLARHAAEVEDFLWNRIGADWDGVGFDVELAALTAGHADAFVRFYGLLADRLMARGAKILSVATGVSATIRGGTVVISEPHTPGSARAQPFRLAIGHPNVIVRPMGYDAGPDWHSRLRAWHEAIIAYATGTVGLEPGQLQLGVKVIGNSQYWDSRTGKLVVTPNEYCCLTDPADVAAWCGQVLRPARVGLVTFAGPGHPGQWNAALNPGQAPPGTVGEPLQVPLTRALRF